MASLAESNSPPLVKHTTCGSVASTLAQVIDPGLGQIFFFHEFDPRCGQHHNIFVFFQITRKPFRKDFAWHRKAAKAEITVIYSNASGSSHLPSFGSIRGRHAGTNLQHRAPKRSNTGSRPTSLSALQIFPCSMPTSYAHHPPSPNSYAGSRAVFLRAQGFIITMC